MRIIASTNQPEVNEKIPMHLGSQPWRTGLSAQRKHNVAWVIRQLPCLHWRSALPGGEVASEVCVRPRYLAGLRP